MTRAYNRDEPPYEEPFLGCMICGAEEEETWAPTDRTFKDYFCKHCGILQSKQNKVYSDLAAHFQDQYRKEAAVEAEIAEIARLADTIDLRRGDL